MNKGTKQNAPDFKPGINFLACLGAMCVTYTNTKTGQVVATFVVDAGNHHLRVPSDCTVDIDCAASVTWTVQKYDPYEYPDQTPVEITVIRPKSHTEELKEYAARMVAKMLGINVKDVELPDDAEDFELDDPDEAPLSLHQIKAMEPDPLDEPAAPSAAPSPSPPPVDTKAAAAPTPSA